MTEPERKDGRRIMVRLPVALSDAIRKAAEEDCSHPQEWVRAAAREKLERRKWLSLNINLDMLTGGRGD